MNFKRFTILLWMGVVIFIGKIATADPDQPSSPDAPVVQSQVSKKPHKKAHKKPKKKDDDLITLSNDDLPVHRYDDDSPNVNVNSSMIPTAASPSAPAVPAASQPPSTPPSSNTSPTGTAANTSQMQLPQGKP